MTDPPEIFADRPNSVIIIKRRRCAAFRWPLAQLIGALSWEPEYPSESESAFPAATRERTHEQREARAVWSEIAAVARPGSRSGARQPPATDPRIFRQTFCLRHIVAALR